MKAVACNDLQGPSVHYYETGEVESRESYVKGNLDGEKKICFKDGTLKQDMFYVNGLLDGDAYTYTKDGQISVEEHYSKGALVSHNEYGSNDKSIGIAKGSVPNPNAPAPNNPPTTADTAAKL
jgi:antitoxin component YwqK of YwqJK toxin-antitoxin module